MTLHQTAFEMGIDVDDVFEHRNSLVSKQFREGLLMDELLLLTALRRLLDAIDVRRMRRAESTYARALAKLTQKEFAALLAEGREMRCELEARLRAMSQPTLEQRLERCR